MNEIEFLCDGINKGYDFKGSPWGENREFVYGLVSEIKPQTIVELGSYLGCSTFTFAQVALDCKQYNPEICAIDTWEGDEHSGFYSDEVYHSFDVCAGEYIGKGVNIHPYKMNFDKALEDFDDHCIDLLHIDGLHTYEAVKHDFENWMPKIKSKGIIIFHDVRVEKDDFGVKKFWNEIKGKHPHIELENTNGLGVLLLNWEFKEYLSLMGKVFGEDNVNLEIKEK